MPRSNSIAERFDVQSSTGSNMGFAIPAFAGVTNFLKVVALSAAALVIAGCSTHAVRETAASTRVHCTAGPLPASFGALPWLLYACDDGRSVALVSAPGNPAAPFTFVVRPTPERVRV